MAAKKGEQGPAGADSGLQDNPSTCTQRACGARGRLGRAIFILGRASTLHGTTSAAAAARWRAATHHVEIRTGTLRLQLQLYLALR